ncbi:MAG: TnpV protein [Ruminococcaceae bacterium]|nr:TnpV protein [Oscillospiraceae bacterium]
MEFVVKGAKNMRKTIIENGLEYTLVGDYFLPNLTLTEEHRPIGKWGRLHREYLKTEHPVLFNSLVLSGKLWTYLADLNEQAQERLFLIVEQMMVAEGVTEDLKASDLLAWVGAMNSIRNRAEEIVLHELIYGEVAV